jgi:hypothetical protein
VIERQAVDIAVSARGWRSPSGRRADIGLVGTGGRSPSRPRNGATDAEALAAGVMSSWSCGADEMAPHRDALADA